MKGKCTVCDKECENLGAHMWSAHKMRAEPEVNLVLDNVTEDKRLSDLIGELHGIIKNFQSSVKISVLEESGRPVEVEMIARIRL